MQNVWRIVIASLLVSACSNPYDPSVHYTPRSPNEIELYVPVQVIDANGFGVSGVEVGVTLKDSQYKGVYTTVGGGMGAVRIGALNAPATVTVTMTIPPGFVMAADDTNVKTLDVKPGVYPGTVKFRISRK